MRTEKLRFLAHGILCVLLVTTIFSISLDRASASYFASRQDFDGGTKTQSVVIEDFTNDMLPDVVAVNEDSILLLRGNGSTTLSPYEIIDKSTTPVPFPDLAPNYIAASDFNEDGNMDLVVSDILFGKAIIYLGFGNGQFTKSSAYTAGGAPGGLVCTDFNNDGNMDFAVANRATKNVSVFWGDGSGGFTLNNTIPADIGPLYLAAADLNGDNYPDLAVANYGTSFLNFIVSPDTVTVWLTNSSGIFTTPNNYPVGVASTSELGPRNVAIGNLNGDTFPDLALPNEGEGRVAVLLGAAGGTFNAATYIDVGPDSEPSFVSIEDLDGNGTQDLIVTCDGHQAVKILLGLGDGSFQAPTTHSVNPPEFADTGDLNRDGNLDLVTCDHEGGIISVLMGDGTGSFGTAPTYPAGEEPQALAAGYLNEDTIEDLAVVNTSTDMVTILLGQADQSFISGGSLDLGLDAAPTDVAITNWNQATDSFLDLAVTNPGSGAVNLYLGNGDGTFSAPQVLPVAIPGALPVSVLAADLNLDTNPDLIVSTAGSNATDNTVTVILGDGAGSWLAGGIQSYQIAVVPEDIAIGPLNDDLALDIAVAGYLFVPGGSGMGPGWAAVLLNNGSYPLAAFDYTSGVSDFSLLIDNPTSLAIGDVDGDTVLDLVANSPDLNSLTYALGESVSMGEPPVISPTGTFDLPSLLPNITSPSQVLFDEINRDGQPDLIVLHRNLGTMSTIIGPPGTFPVSDLYGTGSLPSAGVIVDLNDDLRNDLIVANAGDDTISVLINTAPVGCSDVDLDGFGDPASGECGYPHWDCNDNPINDPDPGLCAWCNCPDNMGGGDLGCASCAKCINPGAYDLEEDLWDSDCNPQTPSPFPDIELWSPARTVSGSPAVIRLSVLIHYGLMLFILSALFLGLRRAKRSSSSS